ncbi:hypothetical protein RchiOBHm_Chr4g0437021 [Rosa chinensis]|uniref:Uncharacterized protein n=1 Tax=Rosa chinensis TaxID=74649 RepID=A0A2P6R272_ROSCH|nr:hypothetical protein RchiOBHm_Chr4g0437021 [Rosa chinensis]
MAGATLLADIHSLSVTRNRWIFDKGGGGSCAHRCRSGSVRVSDSDGRCGSG